MPQPTVLHDTSSVSEFFKHGLHSAASPWFQPPHVPAISFQTAAELLVWSLSKTIVPHGPAQIRQFLADAVVLAPTPAVRRTYAEIMRRRIDLRRPENVKDAWIGATALANRLPLVTYDRTGFLDIRLLGLELLVLDPE